MAESLSPTDVSAARATTAVVGMLLLGALVFYSSAILRWLQRKRYQYEVTFSLYMLTPTEKFIFSGFPVTSIIVALE